MTAEPSRAIQLRRRGRSVGTGERSSASGGSTLRVLLSKIFCHLVLRGRRARLRRPGGSAPGPDGIVYSAWKLNPAGPQVLERTLRPALPRGPHAAVVQLH
eukprot:2333796-Pyramimonas_sp.AAC.1